MTAASNSEARKRATEAASNSESAALATNSPKRGDDTSETANGPQNGVQSSGVHDIYCEGGRCRCFSAVDSEDVGTIPVPVDSEAIATTAAPEIADADWSVGVVAQTVAGEVVLRMTEEQAAQLRDGLNWLTGDDDE